MKGLSVFFSVNSILSYLARIHCSLRTLFSAHIMHFVELYDGVNCCNVIIYITVYSTLTIPFYNKADCTISVEYAHIFSQYMHNEALRIENTTDRINGMDFNTLLLELVVPVTVINSSTPRFFLPVRFLLNQLFFKLPKSEICAIMI